MTEEKFISMKEDFLHEYQEFLCEESLVDIDAAHTVSDFIDILKKYMTFVTCKPFPTSEWVRKWFITEIDEINKCGVFLDQQCQLYNPIDHVICFGRCAIEAHFSMPDIWNFMLYGYSSLMVFTHCTCQVNVRTKDNSIALAGLKHKGSIIKVRKV